MVPTLGDYVPDHSDIDVIAVTDTVVSDVAKRQVVDGFSHPGRDADGVLNR